MRPNFPQIILACLLITPFFGTTQGILKTYKNDLYSIKYPSNWSLTEINKEVFMVLSDEDLPELMTTGTILPSDGYTYADLEREFSNPTNSGLDNADLLKTERIVHNQIEMLCFIYVGTSEENLIKTVIEQYFIISDDKIITLAFICDEEKHVKFESIISEISNSLILEK